MTIAIEDASKVCSSTGADRPSDSDICSQHGIHAALTIGISHLSNKGVPVVHG